jgi:hypothetical protein
MIVYCDVHTPMYSLNGKKYLDIKLEKPEEIERIHNRSPRHTTSPLSGDVLTVKIPFRYNRVMCTVLGSKIIQELVKDDKVMIELEYDGVWENKQTGHLAPSWKIKRLSS